MNNSSMHLKYNRGFTLIEVLASILLLSVIIISSLSLFVQTSMTTNVSKNIMDATYAAQASMEEINMMITNTTSLSNLSNQLINNEYKQLKSDGTLYEKTVTNGYITVEIIQREAPLVTVKVKVYDNKSKTKLGAYMEMLSSWKQ